MWDKSGKFFTFYSTFSLLSNEIVCFFLKELAAPPVEEPENGYLIPNIDLTPLCSSKYRSSSSNDDAQVLTCNLNDIIKDSKWIDLKQLCIAKEKLVWTLYCDITCVDYDGSVLDASVVALCAALRSRMLSFGIVFNFPL